MAEHAPTSPLMAGTASLTGFTLLRCNGHWLFGRSWENAKSCGYWGIKSKCVDEIFFCFESKKRPCQALIMKNINATILIIKKDPTGSPFQKR